MGRPEMATDPRYADHHARGDHQEELDDIIADWTRNLTSADIQDLMDKHGVPAGKIFKAPDMIDNPQFKARDSIVKVDHPDYDKLYMQNVSPKLSKTPGSIQWAGPTEMGQHNKEVYGDILGKTDDEMLALHEAGII